MTEAEYQRDLNDALEVLRQTPDLAPFVNEPLLGHGNDAILNKVAAALVVVTAHIQSIRLREASQRIMDTVDSGKGQIR
jgi:hypothetical protein